MTQPNQKHQDKYLDEHQDKEIFNILHYLNKNFRSKNTIESMTKDGCDEDVIRIAESFGFVFIDALGKVGFSKEGFVLYVKLKYNYTYTKHLSKIAENISSIDREIGSVKVFHQKRPGILNLR